MKFILVLILLCFASFAHAHFEGVSDCIDLLTKPMTSSQIRFYRAKLDTLQVESLGYAKVSLKDLLGEEPAERFLSQASKEEVPLEDDPAIKALYARIGEIVSGVLTREDPYLTTLIQVRDQPRGPAKAYSDSTQVMEKHTDGGALRVIVHIFGRSVEFVNPAGGIETLEPGEIFIFSGVNRRDPRNTPSNVWGKRGYYSSPTWHAAPEGNERRRLIVMTLSN